MTGPTKAKPQRSPRGRGPAARQAPLLLLPLLLLPLLAAAGAAAAPAPERHIVTFDAASEAQVEAGLSALGARVALRGPGFFAVEAAPGGGAQSPPRRAGFGAAKESAFSAARADRISSIAGVTSVEADARRYAPEAGARTRASDWLGGAEAPRNPVDCTAGDVPLGTGPFPEVAPYWLHQVQADSPKLFDAVPSTRERGVLVCVIDSGVDAAHPEFVHGPSSLDGCKAEDSEAPAGCPFPWNSDITGHGTHVSGIIGAPKNGKGVIGAIPMGADIYLVRIFNNSGDVNQGQGFVYGSSLILAYTQCEGKLAYLQATQPAKKWRMVINMSVGAPGPLTIEKLFFEEATKRNDMLFVASSGNNGTDPVQWLNYPSAYEGVLAVGAVNCKNEVMPWSQKNTRVDIVAPGADIISTYPQSRSSAAGATSGYLSFGNVSLNAAPGAFFSGAGSVRAPLADCGYGESKCDAAKGAICLVQGRARKGEVDRDGSPANGGAEGSVPSTCELVKYCVDQGAKAVVLVPPAEIPGFGPYPQDVVAAPNLDCTFSGGTACACWSGGLEKLWDGGKMPPVVAVTIDQADALRGAVKAGGAAPAAVETQRMAYRRMSGTSMATPIVSGLAARLWAAFPDCTSHDLRTALQKTALDLGPRGWDDPSGAGLLQAEAAFDWLQQQPCALAPEAAPRAAEGGAPIAGETWAQQQQQQQQQGQGQDGKQQGQQQGQQPQQQQQPVTWAGRAGVGQMAQSDR
ncbi:serine protease [Raphidocelis subcapitata]|uniref:Serine protease n=1 Tax=Raphidocelis subcapitata TaxID=307507 RepID=A0A2V0P3A5_9CHLO|nr:serine protease [Raphidocelis subcapitata]|eukprot:GBF91555.1 serine protease [Raphidocelis subcapitata]